MTAPLTQQRPPVIPTGDPASAIARKVRPFTGYHMAAIMIAFFGVVVGVNVLMANLAVSTFGGEVVENSYVASQHFNRWLDSAKADHALGWKADIGRSGPTGVTVALLDANGAALAGARVTAIAEHPLGLRDNEHVVLQETAPGHYAATLPAGRWRLRLQATAKGQTWHTIGDLP